MGDHGTIVAGSVLYSCPNTTLYSLKTFSDCNKTDGPSQDVMLTDIINYAQNNDICILNFSSALTRNTLDDLILFKTILETYDGLFFCSAGNYGVDISTFNYYRIPML